MVPRVLLVLILLAAATRAETAADRAVAEWVLRLGGSVVVEGATDEVWDLAALPRTDFRLRAVNLIGVILEPEEIGRVAKVPHLKELYLSGRFWHSLPPRQCADILAPLEALT